MRAGAPARRDTLLRIGASTNCARTALSCLRSGVSRMNKKGLK